MVQVDPRLDGRESENENYLMFFPTFRKQASSPCLILTSSLTYMAKSLRQPVGPTYAIFLDGDVAVFHDGDKHTA